jgi:hypothetical protein
MPVFDEIERTDISAAKYTDPQFDYLNKSARQPAQIIRQSIDTWILEYPAQGTAELCARFRSSDDAAFFSAYFELYLNALLKKLGCNTAIHPMLEDGPKRPDFIVTEPHGYRWFLEATLAMGQSNEEKAAQARKNVVYDSIENLESNDFFIGMDLRGDPQTPPPGKRIRQFLNRQLQGLNPDELEEQLQDGGYDAMPRWPFEHEGWRINFYPIPKSKRLRSDAESGTIGIMFHGARWIDTSSSLKKAIKKKASRYGELDNPYVIAINSMALAANGDSVLDALFGKLKFVLKVTENGPQGEPGTKRDLDGALIYNNSPINTRISAVLIGFNIHPWNRTESNLTLFHNPYAQQKIESSLSELNEVIPENDGSIKFKQGTPSHKILDLEPLTL